MSLSNRLFLGFKRLSCPGAFRWKLIQVAGRIVHHAGQLILKLALDAERLRLFRQIRRRCFELAVLT